MQGSSEEDERATVLQIFCCPPPEIELLIETSLVVGLDDSFVPSNSALKIDRSHLSLLEVGRRPLGPRISVSGPGDYGGWAHVSAPEFSEVTLWLCLYQKVMYSASWRPCIPVTNSAPEFSEVTLCLCGLYQEVQAWLDVSQHPGEVV